jgi:hypothetical protein
MTYRVLKALQFEVEGGLEWVKEERLAIDQGGLDRDKSYFVLVGYRLDF